jgi:hypothetical protein
MNVKNTRSYTATSRYIFVAQSLIKHKDNFTFCLFKFKSQTYRIKLQDDCDNEYRRIWEEAA